MNLATLEEFVNCQEEVDNIAYRIIQERFPDGEGIESYLDDIKFYPDQDKVSIRVEQYGRLSWYNSERIHISNAEFCNPKYMLDQVDE